VYVPGVCVWRELRSEVGRQLAESLARTRSIELSQFQQRATQLAIGRILGC